MFDAVLVLIFVCCPSLSTSPVPALSWSPFCELKVTCTYTYTVTGDTLRYTGYSEVSEIWKPTLCVWRDRLSPTCPLAEFLGSHWLLLAKMKSKALDFQTFEPAHGRALFSSSGPRFFLPLFDLILMDRWRGRQLGLDPRWSATFFKFSHHRKTVFACWVTDVKEDTFTFFTSDLTLWGSSRSSMTSPTGSSPSMRTTIRSQEELERVLSPNQGSWQLWCRMQSHASIVQQEENERTWFRSREGKLHRVDLGGGSIGVHVCRNVTMP